ncbi:hypothetical protein ACRCPS_17815 [Pseudomonas aeruginosa]
MEQYQRIGLITADTLLAIFGPHFHKLEQSILAFMRNQVTGYEFGAFELRKYANGAYALVLESDDPAKVRGSFEDHPMTLEGASLLANITVYSAILEDLHLRGNDDEALLFQQQHYALRDAVRGKSTFVYDPEAPDLQREPTPEEAAAMKQGGPHKDHLEICRYLD